ncbi:MAG: hypothetical protein ACRDUS_11800 [Mycobacterium sp.]
MSDEFGVRTEELAAISKTWLSETLHINDMPWSSFQDASGAGSEVLAAIREAQSQAIKAMSSIARRFSDMSGLVNTFATNVTAQDEKSAASFDALKPR